MTHEHKFPATNHLPIGILLNILVEIAIPVMEPNGASNNDNPRLPSENSILSLIIGIEATHIPKSKLEVENKNPTASAGLSFIKEIKFLIIGIKVSLHGRNFNAMIA